MNQSINFLKGLPRTTSGRLSTRNMTWIVLAFVLFLIILSVILGGLNFQADRRLKAAKNELTQAQQDYNKLALLYPLLASETPFVKRINDLEKEVQTKNMELNTLEHLIVRRGFSEYMLDLAQATPNTLWLNQIQIDHNSTSITLNGYAIHPDSVSELMGRLLTTNAFKVVVFNLFFVKTIKNHPYLKFSIATKVLGPREETDEMNQTAQGAK